MPEKIFTIVGMEEKKYEELSDAEKIETLEAALVEQRIVEKERCVYISEITGKMRTELHYILGYAEVASDYLHDESNLTESTERITASGNRIAKYLLDLKNRMWEDNFALKGQAKRRRWDEIFNDIRHAMKPLLIPKHLTLTVDYRDVYHMEIETELFKIYQIVWSFLENAVQYAKQEGEIYVLVKERAYEKDGYVLFEIRIEDTGIGISEEFIPKLFDFHTREDRKEVLDVIGKGVGLGVAKRAVESLDGTIRVKSVLGNGSVFVVTLPLRVNKKAF